MSDLKIQAVGDKVVAIALKPQKIDMGDSNLVLPENASGHKPQLYLHVLSAGEDVKGIEKDDVIIAHPNGGQLVILDQYFAKILCYGEIYGVLKDHEVTAEDYQEFIPKQPKEESRIVTPEGGIIPGRK